MSAMKDVHLDLMTSGEPVPTMNEMPLEDQLEYLTGELERASDDEAGSVVVVMALVRQKLVQEVLG